jgi:hypothetical protein
VDALTQVAFQEQLGIRRPEAEATNKRVHPFKITSNGLESIKGAESLLISRREGKAALAEVQIDHGRTRPATRERAGAVLDLGDINPFLGLRRFG